MKVTDLVLEHYAEESFTFDLGRKYKQRKDSKPVGFWLSVQGEDDWPSWCRSERFRLAHLENKHIVTMRESANVLFLETELDIFKFNSVFAATEQWRWGIDWPKVAQTWDGIVIAPYQWNLRFDQEVSWYYGWDCASGCIWNLEAIESVEVAE